MIWGVAHSEDVGEEVPQDLVIFKLYCSDIILKECKPVQSYYCILDVRCERGSKTRVEARVL